MAKEYDNTNTGVLFTNEDKQDEKHADRRGSINIEGVEYWLDGWINEIKNGPKAGQKMLKLKAKKKENQGDGGGSQQSGAGKQSGGRSDSLSF